MKLKGVIFHMSIRKEEILEKFLIELQDIKIIVDQNSDDMDYLLQTENKS